MWCGSVAAINTSQLPILLSLQKHKIPTIFTYHIHVSTVGIFFPDVENGGIGIRLRLRGLGPNLNFVCI
jgi:hypothetical protein